MTTEHERHAILDHGYVRLIESWGSDERVVESARMSTQKGFEGWGPFCSKCGIPMVEVFGGGLSAANYERGEQKGCEHDGAKPGDEKLLRYLWENGHETPFEMAGFTIEVQAPIFLFREWHRHRVPHGYSEASARYAPLPEVDYVPTIARVSRNADAPTKQAGRTAPLADEETLRDDLDALRRHYAEGAALQRRLADHGWPKEVARLPNTVGRYSKMRATSNLRGWLALLGLRGVPTAQWEFQLYAGVVGWRIVRRLFPRTWEMFLGGCPSFASGRPEDAL